MTDAPALRIVYFGTPAFAVPSLQALIDSRHPVVGIVSQPDRPRGRGHQLQPTPTRAVAQSHGVPVLQPTRIREESFLSAVRALAPDLGVVAAFGRILPDALLAIPRLGMINVHASLLPRYRGAAPIQRAVLAGDDETGVTIMRVVSELDAGPTFASRRMPIPPDATSGEVEAALATLGAPLLLDVVEAIAAGRAQETPQDHGAATYAPKVIKAEGTIDWAQPARRIHDQVRGLQPWPLASTVLRDVRYVIRRTRVASDAGGPGAPGAIIDAEGDRLIVACGGSTTIAIHEIQPEGRRTMTVREFLSGRRIPPGSRFGA
ncbi:MAG TPA: methionyl-tRNA formyltransferase [Vicinamibacterales bacterium]|nr:methionyl-tRNA formyltransferase [Vicinamibacterales bacterium]